MNRIKNLVNDLELVDLIALGLLFIGLLCVFIIPYLLTQGSWGWSFGVYKANEIGDTIGGITTPIIGLVSSGLVYLALREQVKANRLLSKQIDESRIEKVEQAVVNGLISEIDIIKESYKEYSCVDSQTTEIYNGKDGLDMTFNFFFYGQTAPQSYPRIYVENLDKIGKILSKFNIVKITQKHLIKEFEMAVNQILPHTGKSDFEELSISLLNDIRDKPITLKFEKLIEELEVFNKSLNELKLA